MGLYIQKCHLNEQIDKRLEFQVEKQDLLYTQKWVTVRLV